MDDFSPSDDALAGLAVALAKQLTARSQRLVTAESCTGGWIAKVLTDVAGSSGWFEGGMVTYSNALKSRLLGVEEPVITHHGAVSEPVVRAMAEGALVRTGCDWSLAVSGVAGPGGGTADKPVGLVWFAWAGAGGVHSGSRRFPGDRESVRRFAVAHALERLLQLGAV
ncbi:MAG: CinA family protein [Xanthomonadales bacterium]|nr:CinA family protein [Xanthomonadales bacterium]